MSLFGASINFKFFLFSDKINKFSLGTYLITNYFIKLRHYLFTSFLRISYIKVAI